MKYYDIKETEDFFKKLGLDTKEKREFYLFNKIYKFPVQKKEKVYEIFYSDSTRNIEVGGIMLKETYDPIAIIVNLFNQYYSEFEVSLHFDIDLPKKALGYCSKDEEKNIYIIKLSYELPFLAIPNIFIHELAHVVLYDKVQNKEIKAHGKEFKKVENFLYDKFEEYLNSLENGFVLEIDPSNLKKRGN